MQRSEPYVLVDAAIAPSVGVSSDAIAVPRLIRRNAWLLTIAEAFVGTSQQMVPTLSSIIIGTILGGATFAGAGSSLMGLTRVLVSYPSGVLADRWGRKPVLLLGLLISLLGAVAVGIVVPIGSAPLFSRHWRCSQLAARAASNSADYQPPISFRQADALKGWVTC